MSKNDLMGVAPQDLATNAQGVSLTPPQVTFLDSLLDVSQNEGRPGYARHEWRSKNGKTDSLPLAKLYEQGRAIGLSSREVDYIREWVVNRGVHWLSAEKVGLGENMESRLMFRNPVVRTIINGASERGMCVGTVASKDEVADYYTQRMRSQCLPQVLRDRAAEGLSKLMGYYPKEGNGGGQTVNVQINCVNPYGKETEVEVEDV